ncbi:hypothetical protein [Verrucosispora sp. FIM060022]|uniref:hypothetical protein n=1 Tax=Verrucosispora sp. FIM060022 TaxID=1479020 RepID=UPI000F87BAD0|nr:hypothetical protein [Verrucosispora sp. FIM060022]RUL92352.1 hypothetical protein EG812_17090 [Verrucosispora sp. FIM060022]
MTEANRKLPAPPTSAAPPGMVLVAVPVAHLPHVARLLADLDARQRSAPLPRHRSTPRPDAPTQGWTVDELRRLSRGTSATHRTVAALLDALSAEPGRGFTVEELSQRTGRPRQKIIGAMAGLTRLLKAHHDYAGRGLPFDRSPGRPEAPRELCYSVDRDRAADWREARLPRLTDEGSGSR